MSTQQQEIFQQTEGKLYWYYKTIRKIEVWQGQAKNIEERHRKLSMLRSEYREACSYRGSGAQYRSEKVQGKKSIYHSPIESAYEAMQELNDEISLLLERLLRLETKIVRSEGEVEEIREAVSYLSKIDREICEYKYKYKMSFDDIARVVNLSKSGVRHRRRKIVSIIADRLAGAGAGA